MVCGHQSGIQHRLEGFHLGLTQVSLCTQKDVA
jgi:hypothetical protein